nr:formate dehydrogenase subunit alpha [Anaerolineales bacterium]
PQGAGAGEFAPISWEAALDLAAEKLAGVVQAHGPDQVAGLASARCTNEENYLFQKFFRATLGTNNVDHCARLCHASTVTGLGTAFGSGAMTNPIQDIRHADCVFITGSNTAESHPVIGYEVVRAVKAGANLLIIDPRRIPLVEHATLWLQPKPGHDQYVFMAMAHVIISEGLQEQAFIDARTEGYAEFAESVAAITPEVAALQAGVKAEDIVKAARMYALGTRAHGVSRYAGRGHSSILYAMGITQRRNGTDLVLTLANLALLTGQIGQPSTGINPLRGQSNVQGACDVGALPDVLSGYQKVTDEPKRQAVAAKWGLADLPAKPGLTVTEMMPAILDERIRALYVMGENPMLSDPNLHHVEAALKRLDFLMVQDIFMSETAQFAHLILPAAAWLEKDGTKTNTERRVQLIQPVLKAPGAAQPDWWIVQELARRVAAKLAAPATRWDFTSTREIADELAAVTPSYAGIRHHRLAQGGLCWPCPTETHPGTPILHTEKFTRGLGKFSALTAQGPVENPDAEYPFTLSTGRVLYQYHTGTMTRRSGPLNWRTPHGWAELNRHDADKAGITEGSEVIIRSRRGEVRTEARLGERVPPGVVFLSFHWHEAPANRLTQDTALDPVAKIPEFKVTAVQVEKANGHA